NPFRRRVPFVNPRPNRHREGLAVRQRLATREIHREDAQACTGHLIVKPEALLGHGAPWVGGLSLFARLEDDGRAKASRRGDPSINSGARLRIGTAMRWKIVAELSGRVNLAKIDLC